jgi:hypothetical protein
MPQLIELWKVCRRRGIEFKPSENMLKVSQPTVSHNVKTCPFGDAKTNHELYGRVWHCKIDGTEGYE